MITLFDAYLDIETAGFFCQYAEGAEGKAELRTIIKISEDNF